MRSGTCYVIIIKVHFYLIISKVPKVKHFTIIKLKMFKMKINGGGRRNRSLKKMRKMIKLMKNIFLKQNNKEKTQHLSKNHKICLIKHIK